MANISKKLKGLFNAYLNRIEEERKTRSSHISSYSYQNIYNRSGFGRNNTITNETYFGVIYFYEWSDINRTPKTFYTLKALQNFLESSEIFIPNYQWEIIKHMYHCHISCKKGTKELFIRGNKDALASALNNPSLNVNNSNNGLLIRGNKDEKKELLLPCLPSGESKINRTSPMFKEPSSRWDDKEEVSTWFG